MSNGSLFEWKGYLLTLLSFLFTLIFYYYYSADLYYSFVGALFSAGLVWGSYLVIRMIILTARGK
jgi:hypothetical protein